MCPVKLKLLIFVTSFKKQSMEVKDCFYLGKVVKPFSYKGELVLFFDVDEPSDYADLNEVYIEINQRLVLYKISSMRVSNKIVAKFEDTTPEDSAKLIGKDLYLPLELLPVLDGNKFYFHEVIGFDVEDKSYGMLGKITEIIINNVQPVFSIDCNGKEVLIPIIDSIIEEVKREERLIKIIAPEGLIDIYLS
jgi:16S rRNA processing protein RimM